MPASKAQQKAVSKYMKENYDVYQIRMKPKGRLETVKAHAATQGESANGFINRAIQEAIARDGDGSASKGPSEALQAPPGAGVVSLPSETIDAAQRAAEAAGEATPQFISRAVETQAKRDEVARKMEGA